ncbi:respiratory nitrate reductase subunit gamma [Bacillus sp. JJ1521]|uniref:respiratory nitrate reductase subunit gamma n=1 Tax=Bacillus sp. JJ1521 TaxID=3122957 RepID=UPI002FFF6915
MHVILLVLLFASIPFTKLVHMFSFSLRYPARAPQQYHSRDGYSKNTRQNQGEGQLLIFL